MRGWVRGLIAVVLLASAGAVVLLLSVAAGLSGGWRYLFHHVSVHESDARVQRAVQAGEQRLQVQARDLARDLGAAVPGSGPVLGTLVSHDCAQGQHNYTRSDPYDLLCRAYGSAALLGPQGVERTALLQLADALGQQGWEADSSLSMESLVTDYWDQRAEFLASTRREGYTLADLPTVRLVKPDEPQLVLEVGFVVAGPPDPSLPGPLPLSTGAAPSWAMTDGTTLPASGLGQALPARRFAAVLTLESEVFSA